MKLLLLNFNILVLMSLLLHQQYPEEEDVLLEGEEDAGATMELPVLETDSGNQELEQTMVIRQEDFAELERGNENIGEELKEKKVRENI